MSLSQTICSSLLALTFFSCNSSVEPTLMVGDFSDLEVGSEWLYTKWEKRYDGERTFTGDTLSIRIMANDGDIVTFLESPVGADSIATWDSTTFRFQIEENGLRQIGHNDSRIFGFVGSHGGNLTFDEIDSNRVQIDMDSELFSIRDQVGKSKFVGHADQVNFVTGSYANMNVYYDQTLTYVDGFGHIAVFSREKGVAGIIYFGGFSPIQQFAYELIQ